MDGGVYDIIVVVGWFIFGMAFRKHFVELALKPYRWKCRAEECHFQIATNDRELMESVREAHLTHSHVYTRKE